jgi:WD40 repeat protein
MDINSLDFSDDGKYLVTGSDDNVVNLYDVQEGRYTYRHFSYSQFKGA